MLLRMLPQPRMRPMMRTLSSSLKSKPMQILIARMKVARPPTASLKARVLFVQMVYLFMSGVQVEAPVLA